ncbi:hypothetical protein [uncultured Rhodospira sp.]|uniref:hypothetical protein n=1 Tax=uncultured Rhodospira sp. TaxID=1936189 RepID=UPI0026046590|nr:hypothetical protein [uncultured Rhodospira sp.]
MPTKPTPGPSGPEMSKAQRAAAAPQLGLGAAAALVAVGLLDQLAGLTLEAETAAALCVLCEGCWQQLRRVMEG